MRHIGVDIQDLAQHGSVHTPVRLTEIEDSDAFTLEVEKTQVDEARRCAESRTGTQQRRLPLYSWVTIAENALESELTEFDPLGLQIWAAFSSSEAYLFRGMAAGNQPTPATVPARLGVNRFPSGVPSAAEYRSPGNSLPAAPGLLPVDQRLSQFPGHHDLMGAASPSDVYRESKTVADVLKLIRDIPMYPSSADLITTDADIAALPPFSEALVNFLSMGVVTFALGRMSAYRLDLTSGNNGAGPSSTEPAFGGLRRSRIPPSAGSLRIRSGPKPAFGGLRRSRIPPSAGSLRIRSGLKPAFGGLRRSRILPFTGSLGYEHFSEPHEMLFHKSN
ncbi:hypothetical protein CYMTET_38536 [Cymbomonas tetramitiformis]|uniref:Uncharacterized protein n=1 Tax=Cymbomonas tetramitiformis TaxID=36881 RepID=A0AAE0F5K8_9CHLO|nr:hypothetical protein CYMTET_38536 [Cymbomonas tetramitiformis]